MTGLLTAAAIIATIMLVISATRTAANATASDPNKRGPWGICLWTSERSRPLNPHERRWQTALLTGKDNPSRWDSVVVELAALENLADVEPIDAAPTSHDHQWIEASIANLEAHIHDPATPGDPSS